MVHGVLVDEDPHLDRLERSLGELVVQEAGQRLAWLQQTSRALYGAGFLGRRQVEGISETLATKVRETLNE